MCQIEIINIFLFFKYDNVKLKYNYSMYIVQCLIKNCKVHTAPVESYKSVIRSDVLRMLIIPHSTNALRMSNIRHSTDG